MATLPFALRGRQKSVWWKAATVWLLLRWQRVPSPKNKACRGSELCVGMCC